MQWPLKDNIDLFMHFPAVYTVGIKSVPLVCVFLITSALNLGVVIDSQLITVSHHIAAVCRAEY